VKPAIILFAYGIFLTGAAPALAGTDPSTGAAGGMDVAAPPMLLLFGMAAAGLMLGRRKPRP
jgi:hypothetical protein